MIPITATESFSNVGNSVAPSHLVCLSLGLKVKQNLNSLSAPRGPCGLQSHPALTSDPSTALIVASACSSWVHPYLIPCAEFRQASGIPTLCLQVFFIKIFFDFHFGGRSTTLILYFVSNPCFYLTIFPSPFIFSLLISCPLNIRVKSCLFCSPLYILYRELYLFSGRCLINSCWQRKEWDMYIQIYKWANEWIVYICFSHVRNLKYK